MKTGGACPRTPPLPGAFPPRRFTAAQSVRVMLAFRAILACAPPTGGVRLRATSSSDRIFAFLAWGYGIVPYCRCVALTVQRQ